MKEQGKLWSTHATPCGLWDFPGVVNLYEKFPHESLHSNSLGFTVELVDNIVPYAKSIGLNGDAIVTEFGSRMSQLPRLLNLPSHAFAYA